MRKMQEIIKGCDSITSELTVLNSAEEIEECIADSDDAEMTLDEFDTQSDTQQ